MSPLRTSLTSLIALSIALLGIVSIGSANPSGEPVLSDTPDCIRVEPGGTFTVPVLVRHWATGEPVPDTEVFLIFSAGCTDLFYCAGEGPVTVLITDAGGEVEFRPRMGGCCAVSGAVQIEANPGAVTLASYNKLGSSDSNGDGEVGIIDYTLFQAAFLGTDACHDFINCDEIVEISDFTVFQRTFGNECP